MYRERKEIMKKIILLLALFIFGTLSAFSETKLYSGVGLCADYSSDPDDTTKAVGFQKKLGFSAKAVVDYKYIYSDTLFTATDSYYHIEDHTYLKYNVFFLGTACDFSSSTKYFDITVGVDYKVNPFNWLEIEGIASVGYVPLNVISVWEENNKVVTKLQINVKVFNIVTLYAGMESLEIPTSNILHFNTHSIKNTIGAKAEYFFDNIGVYASIDYYCKHPEVAYDKAASVANSVKYTASVGAVIKI